jgi:outer membrane protein OmpA-like peptidoglycan-associated protein
MKQAEIFKKVGLSGILIAVMVLLTGNSMAYRRLPVPESKQQPIVANIAVGGGVGLALGDALAEFPALGIVGAGIGLVFSVIYNQNPALEKYGVQFINLHGRLIILIPTDVLFEINGAKLRKSVPQVLGPIAELLKKYPDANIHISGNNNPITPEHRLFHDDAPGLSMLQATQIAGYFWEKDVRQGRRQHQVMFGGNGDLAPIAANTNLAGMMLNRRIQIAVYPEGLNPYPDSIPILPPEKQKRVATTKVDREIAEIFGKTIKRPSDKTICSEIIPIFGGAYKQIEDKGAQVANLCGCYLFVIPTATIFETGDYSGRLDSLAPQMLDPIVKLLKAQSSGVKINIVKGRDVRAAFPGKDRLFAKQARSIAKYLRKNISSQKRVRVTFNKESDNLSAEVKQEISELVTNQHINIFVCPQNVDIYFNGFPKRTSAQFSNYKFYKK